MDEKRICCCCNDPIEDDDEEACQDNDGNWYCGICADNYTFVCDMCGERFPEDQSNMWGDCTICDDCMEEQCPSFDKKENEEETQNAYETFIEAYIGRTAVNKDAGEIITIEDCYEDGRTYSFTVELDGDCKIQSISRMNCEMMMWESVNSSAYRPYPIEDSDYEDLAVSMIEDELDFSEPEDDDDEPLD